MKIFLVRAAQSIEPRPGALAEAYLSAVGRQVTRAMGRRIKAEIEAMEIGFDAIVAAPEVAATQTAELFADAVDHLGVVESLHLLLQGVPPHLGAERLLSRSDAVVAVVAEEPALSALGAFLVGRPTFPPLMCSQVSLIEDRRPTWSWRPDTMDKVQLVVS